MKFVVTQEIFELFPGLKLPVIVAEDVEAAADSAGVERLWRQAWENARLSGPEYGNAQSHPHVAAWRDAMAAAGVSGRKFSPALSRVSAQARAEAHPRGGNLPGKPSNPWTALWLRGRGWRGGLYASGNEVLRRRFVWKQSYKGLLGDSTSSVFLVCEVLGEVEESADGLAQAVLEDLSKGVRRYFGAEPATFVVEERVSSASW